ncbi:MAG: FHA domain-containing protein [Rubrivivax sp.]|nr:FHA domain-containing protein [Rubrivivax sp.]
MLSLKIVSGLENAEKVQPVANVPPGAMRFVIGRDPKCDWPILDRQLALSARHCEIVRIEGRHVLRDTSTNGTSVNGARERLPAEHLLRHGDRIHLGNYVIEVSVVPDAAAAPAAAAVAAAAAPRRGGDPAAMVGANWERAAVRSDAYGADMKTGMTRISKPPPRQHGGEPQLVVTPPRSEPGAEPPRGAAVAPREGAWRAPPGTPDILQRLAGGLGVPPQALGASDPALAAERVARLLRLSVLALVHQMDQQGRQLQAIGSGAAREFSHSEAAALRTAQGPEEAITALLAAGPQAEAVLMRAHGEVNKHAPRLLEAFAAASARLGEQLAPAALERSVGTADDAQRLWRHYSSLWTALGIGVGKGWTEAYAAAAASYLAEAYDKPLRAEKP